MIEESYGEHIKVFKTKIPKSVKVGEQIYKVKVYHLVMLCHLGKIKLVDLTKYTRELEELHEALKTTIK